MNALIVMLLLVLGCTQKTPAAQPTKAFKVLSYNIEKGSPIEKIARELQAEDPDIVLLQEVDQGTNRSGRIDQTAVLAARLSMYSFYSPSYRDDGGTTGQAILSRFPLKDTTIVTLPKSRNIAAAATVVIGEKKLRVVSAHFSSSVQEQKEYEARAKLAREKEAERIVALLKEAKLPAIVGADVNDLPGSRPHQILTQALRDVGPAAYTWPSLEPSEQIDFLLVSPSLSAEHPEVSGPLTSDHRMISVEVSWRE